VPAVPPRLRLAAWSAARGALTALRERPPTRPLAEAIIDAARARAATGDPDDALEREREEAVRRWLQSAQPTEPVPRRVVMVCDSLSPGGSERQLALTVRGLMARGVGDVTVLCAHLAPGQPQQYDFYRGEIAASGAAVRPLARPSPLLARLPCGLDGAAPALPAGLLCDIADLWRELGDLRPAVVHAWLDWANIRAGVAAGLAGVPRILLSGRNLNPSRFVFHQPAMRPLYRALLARPEVVCLNNSLAGAQDYARWLDVPAQRIGVLRNGFDLPPADSASAAAERRRLGVPAGTLLVGSMFRFQPEKRVALWLKAAAALRARHAAARFVLYGAGPLLPELRRRAAALGLQSHLMLPGLTRDPLAALGAMDVFLLTSEAEGTPNVLIEAQWAGTPVVATAAGGVGETLEPGTTGILVERAEPQTIAEAVLAAAAPEWRARTRTAGPALVAARFGLARMIEETLAAYGFAADGRGRAAG
jgi:glycosyltransferase involved in cell wall biosynthesis